MHQRSVDRPALWIVAGPNGSGKSTLYDKTEIQGFWGTVWIINPDALTARIREREGLDLLAANGDALDRIEKWLTTSVDAYQTVGVETVLSTNKYRALVDHAKSRGFQGQRQVQGRRSSVERDSLGDRSCEITGTLTYVRSCR